MKIPKSSLKNVADLLSCSFKGDPDLTVAGVNEIHVVEEGDIVFVDHPKYYDKALSSKATVVIINQDIECPSNKGLIISEDPFQSFNFLINFFSPFDFNTEKIAPSAKIGANCKIHDTVTLGNNVTIGDNCILHPNVCIYDNCIIENNVIIHANTVIGGHGFYYKNRKDRLERLNSGGRVIIRDYVEIGTGTTIDKGVTGDTIIGRHTKLDNQVHIGHDTKLGEMCIIAAQVAIAGCSNIGNHVTMWGQVGIASGVNVEDHVTVFAQSGTNRDLKEGLSYYGSPAEEARKKMKEIITIRQLPSLLDQLKHGK